MDRNHNFITNPLVIPISAYEVIEKHFFWVEIMKLPWNKTHVSHHKTLRKGN